MSNFKFHPPVIGRLTSKESNMKTYQDNEGPVNIGDQRQQEYESPTEWETKQTRDNWLATCQHPRCNWTITQPTQGLADDWASFHTGTMGVDFGMGHEVRVEEIKQ